MLTARFTTLLALAALSLLAGCNEPRPSDPADVKAIQAVMRMTWDKPDAPLTVEPVVVVGHFAVADWSQPALAGRALLQRSADTWSVVLCAGNELLDPAIIEAAGVAPADARLLATQLMQVEKSMAPVRLERIGKFRSLVRMESSARGNQTQ